MVTAWNFGLGQEKLPVVSAIMSCSFWTPGLRAAMAPRPMA